MESSEDEDEFEEDYKDGSSLHEALLRKIGMLCQRCVENERLIKRLKMELRLSKSHARQTKHQIRIDYDWDGRRLILLTRCQVLSGFICFHILSFWRMDEWNMMKVRTAFPHLYRGRYRSLKEWITRINGREYICPTVQAKYVSIRCNLNNEIQRTYKSKFIHLRTMLFLHY